MPASPEYAELLEKRWLAFRKDLRVGDIILVCKYDGILPRFIHHATKSYWNHVVLVFETWDNLPFGGPLIVEATNDGIEIHRLKKYTDNFDKCDIAVLRLPQLGDAAARDLVRGFILNNLDIPYDYGRLVGMLLRPWAKRSFKRNVYLRMARPFINDQYFTCSAFIHKAFHTLRKLGPESRTLLRHVHGNLETEEMSTPGDIARDGIFTWVFGARRA